MNCISVIYLMTANSTNIDSQVIPYTGTKYDCAEVVFEMKDLIKSLDPTLKAVGSCVSVTSTR
jgi:hypothetical protein